MKLGFINNPAFPLRRFVPVLEAAIQESHQHGVRVAVHAEELETAKVAVRAGADLLAHTVTVTGCFIVGRSGSRGTS